MVSKKVVSLNLFYYRKDIKNFIKFINLNKKGGIMSLENNKKFNHSKSKEKNQVESYKPFKFEHVENRFLKIPKCKFLLPVN